MKYHQAAVHEAGHCVVCALVGHLPESAIVMRDGGGETRVEASDPLSRIAIACAGAIAGGMDDASPPHAKSLSSSDNLHVQQAIKAAKTSDPDGLLTNAVHMSVFLLHQHWQAVESVAELLTTQKFVGADAIRKAVRKTFAAALVRKELDGSTTPASGRSVVARMTSVACDRDGEVVLPAGGRLDHFKSNPVVFLDHAWQKEHPEYALPIGKASGIKTSASEITTTVSFADRPKTHPATSEWIPDTVLSLYQQRVMKGWSIGFIPLFGRHANDADRAKYGDGCTRVIEKWLLLELSATALPSNQEALTLAVAKGALKASTAKRWSTPPQRHFHLLIEMPAARKEKRLIFV